MSEDGETNEAPKNLRTYIVFEQEESGAWVEMTRVEATGAQLAIRRAVSEDGVYVAVSERAFQPMRLSTESKPLTKLAPA